jgi:hypothetical protein
MSPQFSSFDSVITQFRINILIHSQYTTCENKINEEENIENVVLSGEGDVNIEIRENYPLG